MHDLLNQLPCPTLITDKSGYVLAVNTDLLVLVGGTLEHWLHKPMEIFFPPAGRIFLQTHVWPMLFSEGHAREIYLKISDAQNQRIPVMMNCRQGLFTGVDGYFWAFFVALERSKFEVELLDARNRAESSLLALAERESFVKTFIDAVPGLVTYWDKDLCCRFVNKTYLEWFGTLPEAIISTTLNEPSVLGVLAGESQVFEATLTKADGSICFTTANYLPDFNALGAVVGFFVLVCDITTVKTTELELRLAARVFECTVEGIMVTDDQGIILSVNAAFSKITGYTAKEAIGQTPRLLKSNHHDQDFYAALWQIIASVGCWEGEIWNRRKDGEVFLEWQSITAIHGANFEPVRYVSVFNDITKFWQKNERMRHLAVHDSLTDLPNRTLLVERLDHLLAMTEREHRNIAVLFLDLDGFKAVNDKLGHDIGDDVLKSVAKKLLAQVRQLDTVARLGGDEFVILLDNPMNNDEVAGIAARIVSIINVPVELRGKSASVGVSIGIAMYPVDGRTTAELMKSADTAMYAAKLAGKNSYKFHKKVFL
jgi:diguanylate cyclase (GGDEF)-like protein/PAS domain S-box-containing protein